MCSFKIFAKLCDVKFGEVNKFICLRFVEKIDDKTNKTYLLRNSFDAD